MIKKKKPNLAFNLFSFFFFPYDSVSWRYSRFRFCNSNASSASPRREKPRRSCEREREIARSNAPRVLSKFFPIDTVNLRGRKGVPGRSRRAARQRKRRALSHFIRTCRVCLQTGLPTFRYRGASCLPEYSICKTVSRNFLRNSLATPAARQRRLFLLLRRSIIAIHLGCVFTQYSVNLVVRRV